MDDYTYQIELLNSLNKELMLKYKRIILQKERREKLEKLNSSKKKTYEIYRNS